MIQEIMKKTIDFLKISPYEECILTKIKYNFKLSEKEKFQIYILTEKLFLYRLYKIGGKK